MQRDLFQLPTVVPAVNRLGGVHMRADMRDEFRYEDGTVHGLHMDAPQFVPLGSHWNFDYDRNGLEFLICSHVKVR